MGTLLADRDAQASGAKIFEHSAYRILYRLTGQQKTLATPEAASLPIEEMIYKVSLLDSKKNMGVSPTGWLEIRFLDSNDYTLASDLISHEKLSADREYYAYLWVPQNKLAGVQDVRLERLTVQEFPAARARVLLRRKLTGEKADDVTPQISEKASGPTDLLGQASAPDQLELNREKKLSIIDQNIERIQVMLGRSESTVPATSHAASNDANQALETEEAVDSAMNSESAEPRLTNDDLAKFLKEADAEPATLEETPTVTE